jgi:hypothetical protein
VSFAALRWPGELQHIHHIWQCHIACCDDIGPIGTVGHAESGAVAAARLPV